MAKLEQQDGLVTLVGDKFPGPENAFLELLDTLGLTVDPADYMIGEQQEVVLEDLSVFDQIMKRSKVEAEELPLGGYRMRCLYRTLGMFTGPGDASGFTQGFRIIYKP